MQIYPSLGDMCVSGSQTKLDESWTVERNKQKKDHDVNLSINLLNLKRQNNA